MSPLADYVRPRQASAFQADVCKVGFEPNPAIAADGRLRS